MDLPLAQLDSLPQTEHLGGVRTILQLVGWAEKSQNPRCAEGLEWAPPRSCPTSTQQRRGHCCSFWVLWWEPHLCRCAWVRFWVVCPGLLPWEGSRLALASGPGMEICAQLPSMKLLAFWLPHPDRQPPAGTSSQHLLPDCCHTGAHQLTVLAVAHFLPRYSQDTELL